MTKQKSIKRALLFSALSLLLCVSMLVGSTFAWFTDSVTSAGNKIQSGTLDVQLLMDADVDGNYDDISNSAKPIFGTGSIAQNVNSETLWEPGKTQVAYLAIKNNGNLALKYTVGLNVQNVSKDLYKVMKYAIVADADNNHPFAGWTTGNAVTVGTQSVSGDVSLAAGATHYFALAIHMDETAGNEYQGGEVNFDLTVLATQDTVESDSISNQYDKDATYPLVATGIKAGRSLILPIQTDDFSVNIAVPESAEDGAYKVVIPPESIDIDDENIAFDMYLELNGQKVQPKPGVEYIGTITLPHPFVTVEAVYHNGKKINHYHTTGETEVSFSVSDFSPFEIVYKDHTDDSFPLDYEIENEEVRIYKGMFVGLNPATIDSTLLGDNSEYIAVDYVKDGVKYYVVSERATTIFLSTDTTATYECESGTYAVKNNQNGKLYSVISSLQSNKHSTVYLLPGTYNEATTINVYSSMDIIGLGNAEDINIIKVKGSYSNRHLFNCNGAVTRNEHIEVSLHNLTLDASAKNLNSAGKLYTTDNAAVQSIRLSKVKCYNLDIIKSSGFAFYVNGKYDGRGAYMYAENCSMTTNSVIDTASTYRFYYDNLTYGKGEYTNNTSYIQNKTMQANDWIWD